MAPPGRPPRVHTSTQNFARSNGQDYTPGWLLVQPVTIQNQRINPLVRTPEIPEQRRAIQDYPHDQQQTRPYTPTPTLRIQSPQPDALNVQERLYNFDSAPSLPSQAQRDLTALPANGLDRSFADGELAAGLQHGLYAVHEPRAQGGFQTFPDEEITHPRYQALSRQQRETLEIIEPDHGRIRNTTRAEQNRCQEALKRPSYSTTFGHQHKHIRAETNRTRENPRRSSYASNLGHRQVYQPNFPDDGRRTRDTTVPGRQKPQILPDSIQNSTEGFHTQSKSPNKDTTKPTSKRASKAAKVLEMHGQDTQLGADNQPKGLVQFTRFRNSQVQWRNSDREHWRSAVYHYQLRQKYVVQQDPLDRFDVARAMGNEQYDVTTYLGLWRHWRPNRKDGWQGVQAEVLYRFERDGYPIPNYTPEYLMDEGRIVLDLDNHPVKNWRELPLCLSSALEGSDIETVRRINPGITLIDIRARMPKHTLTGPRKDKVTPLFGLTALGNRTVRFREKNVCPSWLERTGSDRLRDYVWSLMSQQQRNAKSTQGLGMLTELQLAEFKEQTKGKFLERAGSRALTDEERKKRHAADAEKLSQLRENAGPQRERSSNQRKRNYTVSLDTDDEDEVQFLGSKRRKTLHNTPSVEQEVEDELEALYPSREAEAHLNALYPSYPLPDHSLPGNSRNPDRRNRSRFVEDNSRDDSFLPELNSNRHRQPSYALEDPFTGSTFGTSTYRPPILYPARSGFQPGPATNSGRATPGFGNRSPRTLSNASHNPLASFPVGYNPIPDDIGGSSNRKRRYSNTRVLDDEQSDPEPKRRGSIQRSRFPDNSFASQDIGVSSRRSPFPHGGSRRYNSAARTQRPTLQGLTEPYSASYATHRQQHSVREIAYTRNNEDRIISDNADFSNNVSSIASVARDNGRSLKKQLVSDALFYGDGLFFNYENLDSADAAPETPENRTRLRTLSPSPEMENTSATVLLETNHQQQRNSEEDVPQRNFHVGTRFEIREDTPETHQEGDVSHGQIGFEDRAEDAAADSDKENQIPTPHASQVQGSMTPAAETTHTRVVSLDDVQLDNVVSGSDLEAALIRNFFDLEAAASEEPLSLDYRFVEPHSAIDERLVNDAPWYTLAEVSWLTGATVTTTQRNSYQSQYEEIEAAFASLWLLETPAPQLVRLGPWYRSFEHHPIPNMTIEHFNELLLALPENAPPWQHPGDI